jgi:hypothetical protein
MRPNTGYEIPLKTQGNSNIPGHEETAGTNPAAALRPFLFLGGTFSSDGEQFGREDDSFAARPSQGKALRGNGVRKFHMSVSNIQTERTSMGRSSRPFCRKLSLLTVGALCLCLAPAVWSQNDPNPEVVSRGAENALESRRAVQQKLDDWAAEKAALFAEMNRMEMEIRRLEWERRQTEAFLRDLSQKAADFSTQKAEAEALRGRIGPLLDETLERLSAIVASDLPFAREERTARLDRVRRSLTNADADAVQRTRTLLDAVTAEVKAGYAAGVDTADIDVGGEPIRVRRFHVGRLGLYALSPDNRSAWLWKPKAGEWTAIPEHAPAIADAVRIAEGHRLAELVALPFAPPDLGEWE